MRTESGQMYIHTSSKKSKSQSRSLSRPSVSGLVCTDCGQQIEMTENTEKVHFHEVKLQEWNRLQSKGKQPFYHEHSRETETDKVRTSHASAEHTFGQHYKCRCCPIMPVGQSKKFITNPYNRAAHTKLSDSQQDTDRSGSPPKYVRPFSGLDLKTKRLQLQSGKNRRTLPPITHESHHGDAQSTVILNERATTSAENSTVPIFYGGTNKSVQPPEIISRTETGFAYVRSDETVLKRISVEKINASQVNAVNIYRIKEEPRFCQIHGPFGTCKHDYKRKQTPLVTYSRSTHNIVDQTCSSCLEESELPKSVYNNMKSRHHQPCPRDESSDTLLTNSINQADLKIMDNVEYTSYTCSA